MNADNQAIRGGQFVEEAGIFFERLGTTRMAGRVFGRLLISVPPHQTMDELAEALQASKGSISSSTRYLIQLGLIERIGIPGERRDYFRVTPNVWVNVLRQRVGTLALFEDLARRGLELLEGENPDMRERLEEFLDYLAFIEEEFPGLLERWVWKVSVFFGRSRTPMSTGCGRLPGVAVLRKAQRRAGGSPGRRLERRHPSSMPVGDLLSRDLV